MALWVRERAVLVAYGLIGLVLKRIRVNRVEFEAEFVRQGLYLRCVLRDIPGNVQRYGAAGPVERVEQADVQDFFFQAAGFAAAGKAGKAGTASAQCPTGHGNLQCRYFGKEGVDIMPVYGQAGRKKVEGFTMARLMPAILFTDLV